MVIESADTLRMKTKKVGFLFLLSSNATRNTKEEIDCTLSFFLSLSPLSLVSFHREQKGTKREREIEIREKPNNDKSKKIVKNLTWVIGIFLGNLLTKAMEVAGTILQERAGKTTEAATSCF